MRPLAAAADGRPLVYLTPRGAPLHPGGRAPLCRRARAWCCCAAATKASTSASSRPAACEESASATTCCRAASWRRWSCWTPAVRLLPGVMGAAESAEEESFAAGLLEYPALHPPGGVAGPPRARGAAVRAITPPIAAWRRAEAERITRERRPDLWAAYASRRNRTPAPVASDGARRKEQDRKDQDDEHHPAIRGGADRPPDREARRSRTSPPATRCASRCKVVEGERTRTQAFEGVCIARSNKGLNSNFTVRKISYGEGVERVFPLYSPTIAEIAVRAPRRRAPRQALLSARPQRQVRPHRRERPRATDRHRPPRPRPRPEPPAEPEASAAE